MHSETSTLVWSRIPAYKSNIVSIASIAACTSARRLPIMPRTRPQLSITLPRNFTFHYTEGEEPKTPEQEQPAPLPPSPHAYRIKRRTRPSISTITNDLTRSQDTPIPTIEAPILVEPVRPMFQQRATEPIEGHLAPIPSRRFVTLPRTPSAQRISFDDAWVCSKQLDLGQSISRPMSTCSIMSDSSDDSNGSLSSSHQSQGGSCTSPESDAADPFGSFPTKKGKKISRPSIALDPSVIVRAVSKQNKLVWTAEMDKHLWSMYLLYLQHPTVTPFKMLPGTAPPLGVCHRVAREARRTWRGAKTVARKPSSSATPRNSGEESSPVTSEDSPGTIRASRSGSNTPTGLVFQRLPAWPKSGSSTRRRLRELCKRKATIAPHYQRLLQTRSPSPFSSSSPARSQSSRLSSPVCPHYSPFNTRDIQLSLTTSTAATMQPGGPLAQLASKSSTANIMPAQETPGNGEWFNEPPVPWASPTAIPSDLGLGSGVSDGSSEAPRLGSPFGFHTWGPSRSRQHTRPSTSESQARDAATIGPSLRSPFRMQDSFPYPSVHKRRAQHQLEDELSPGGSDMRKNLLEDLFGGPSESRHRRVRSRGFSLGDVNANGGRLQSMFTPPVSSDIMPSSELSMASMEPTERENGQPTLPAQTIRRLGSPFSGFGPRPISRRSQRHMASASLSAYDPSNFASIDQRLGQATEDELFRRCLPG